MISIVIRNRNEGKALENTLSILTNVYSKEFNEIIIVDNNSTDNSLNIALKYKCRVITINNFSYGRATNLGIEAAETKYVLMLSSHSIPIGKSFFKNTFDALNERENIAGIRYINSIENYNRAIKNDFKIQEPLKFGLMTGCAVINKDVWNRFKFDEDLPFSEDKEWSKRVFDNGYAILDLNETFFYFIKRDLQSSVSRFRNETLSEFLLHGKKYPSLIIILTSFIKKIIFINTINYFKQLRNDFLFLKVKIEVSNKLKK